MTNQSDRRFFAVVLAAGQGTRMKSDRPKVMHAVAGRPMVAWPVEAALRAGAERVVVVIGHGKDEVEREIRARWDDRVVTAVQAEQRGTGHAVQCAMPALEGEDGDVVILYGDVPLLEAEAITALLDVRGSAPLALLTCRAPDPKGYGRILRGKNGAVIGIREHKDASEAERAIDEINPGVYALDASFLRDGLASLTTNNAQGELYLTDLVERAASKGGAAGVAWPITSLAGVNDRAQLAEASRAMYRRIATVHAQNGVTVRDLDRVTIDAEVTIEPDATIEPDVVLRGKTRLARGAHVDVGSVLTDVVVGERVHVKPYCVASESTIGPDAQVGPFAHLRPGSELGPDVRIGNFVETKKTKMGRGSKANHLAYLGDGIIEEDVNVGAGTIFCNWDGFQKHTTVIEAGSFIGSDSQLVAPVRVGKNAIIGSGTTVTKDVPADSLTVSRIRQSNKEGYAPRLRARLKAAADEAKKK